MLPFVFKTPFLRLDCYQLLFPQIINKTIWETHHFQISLLGKQWVSISMLRDYVIYTTPWENYSFSQSFMVKSSCLLFLATIFFLAKTSQFVRRAFHHIGIGVLRICCGHLKLRCNSWHFEKGQNHDFSPAKFEIDPSFMAILLGKIMLHRWIYGSPGWKWLKWLALHWRHAPWSSLWYQIGLPPDCSPKKNHDVTQLPNAINLQLPLIPLNSLDLVFVNDWPGWIWMDCGMILSDGHPERNDVEAGGPAVVSDTPGAASETKDRSMNSDVCVCALVCVCMCICIICIS